jgi:hypothetical protein
MGAVTLQSLSVTMFAVALFLPLLYASMDSKQAEMLLAALFVMVAAIAARLHAWEERK